MDKKTIVVVTKMFDKYSYIDVINSNEVLENKKVSMKDIAEETVELANKYEIKTINIKGSKMFNQKTLQEIKEKGLTKYNQTYIINLVK